MIRAAEAQRVEIADRARPHGEDIAQDAADAGRCALIGLDIRRVVMAFHFKYGGLAVADVDDAGVFARTTNHLRPFGRQCF